jgi:hypothetical protein
VCVKTGWSLAFLDIGFPEYNIPCCDISHSEDWGNKYIPKNLYLSAGMYGGTTQTAFCLTRLGPFAKLRKAASSFVVSVCPSVSTRYRLDGLSLNLMSVFRKSV